MSTAKLSREEFRKQKELEEARKAGTAPAEVDEEGHEINPHIPQYIAKAPWYIDTGAPTLRHQRVQKTDAMTGHDLAIQQKGLVGQAVTKYRPGACTNCGAMTHKAKECIERPRRLAAKFSGSDIKPDEVLIEASSASIGFEGKRDRWNGYDPREYESVIRSYEYVEQERKRMKEEELEKKLVTDAQKATSELADAQQKDARPAHPIEDDEIDEEKYAEQTDAVGQKVDLKSRMTVRNLRIREDTAKYLRNLDLGSAYYDPKTRSMRENPNKDVHPSQLSYAGDNFVRYTGEATHVNQLQLFCWEASEKGLGVHLQAAPSETEKKYKQFSEKKAVITTEINQSILEKYGGAEYLAPLPKEILYGASGESEVYVEYSKSGKVVRGTEKIIPRSKYTEDAFVNNHTCVWGSYWEKGNWGYACCHSFIQNSYCSGEAGKEAHRESVQRAYSG